MMSFDELIKIFDNWTILKVRIHLADKKVYPKERQIWWVSLGQNIGTEINGKNERFERPVIVIKKYHNDAYLVLPLSTKSKVGTYYLSFVNKQGETNIMNFSQIRSISTKRFVRMIGKIGSEDFIKMKDILKKLL